MNPLPPLRERYWPAPTPCWFDIHTEVAGIIERMEADHADSR